MYLSSVQGDGSLCSPHLLCNRREKRLLAQESRAHCSSYNRHQIVPIPKYVQNSPTSFHPNTQCTPPKRSLIETLIGPLCIGRDPSRKQVVHSNGVIGGEVN